MRFVSARRLTIRATPATAYASRPKAAMGDRTADTHDRVPNDRTEPVGKLTLRVNGRLHPIGTGHEHARNSRGLRIGATTSVTLSSLEATWKIFFPAIHRRLNA